MAELNREKIIKALEWCIQSDSCEYCEYNDGKADVCSIRSDALSLIKKLIEEKKDIFEEIYMILDKFLSGEIITRWLVYNFDELKKKYIGEKGE